jgi:RteC protein
MDYIKVPQGNLEAFLDNDFNIEIYEDLTEKGEYEGLFDPLLFFNLLYEEFNFFYTNSMRYLDIKNHFKEHYSITEIEIKDFDYIDMKKYYFLWAINELIDKEFENEKNAVTLRSCEYVEILYTEIKNHIYPNNDNNNFKFDFDEVKIYLETIELTKDKISYLTVKKTDYLQNKTDFLDSAWEVSFDKKCTLEIDKLKEFQKIETTNITVENQVVEPPLKTLNWQGTTLEFSELSKALCESGLIGKVKNDKEVFESMKQFFNVEDFDKSDKLKQVRNRTKELTPLINRLEVALTNWIKRKD